MTNGEDELVQQDLPSSHFDERTVDEEVAELIGDPARVVVLRDEEDRGTLSGK